MMIVKRSLLESVTIVSCSSTAICAFLNYVTNISPLTGYWFITYTILVFIASIIFSVKTIQWFLHLNKPLNHDLEALTEKYPFASYLVNILPQIPKKSPKPECKEYDTNELSIITTVLEKKLVSSWYIHYISQEISFPFACKQMLDQMISRAFQICNKIETKDVYVHMCALLITHLKEYKKAVKRHEKSPAKSVESLYKKVHKTSDPKGKKTADHCVDIIRIVMKELVPWELWDTPHSELLVRILAKKLDTFIEATISDPVWLNDKLIRILTASKTEEHKATDLDAKDEVSNQNEMHSENANDTNVIKNDEPREIQENITNKKEETKIVESEKCLEAKEVIPSSEPVEIKPVLRQRRGRQGRNEVKIYDRIIEGSVKTWETDLDLQCISMGQDLLASIDELALGRLWGHEEQEPSPNNIRRSSPQPLWFGEEDAIDLDPEPAKETKASPKATEALLKDIQSTVNQAKTKIGDLQVPLHIDKPPSDEAAGMMEGLLDKGIAGIKKGLRLTGLSDDSQEKSPSHQRDRVSPSDPGKSRGKLDVVTEHHDIKEYTSRDDVNSVPHLVKQQRLPSQDSTSQWRAKDIPAALSESPEPQYEEAADLSHTIAKLRSLLNEATPRSEEVWWEGAAETRGRAQTHSSERHVDTATLADEYDMSVERGASPTHATNNMQRLDKLFQRTVTGVFNSIRTAVGAEGEGEPPAHWTYLTTSMDLSVGVAVSRLVGGRRALSHVDAALDSLHHLPARAPSPPADDFEESCACCTWSALSELGLCQQHVSYRIATLLLADVAETLICGWLEDFTAWIKQQVFVFFEKLSESDIELHPTEPLREFNIDETVDIIMQKMPETYIFGEEQLAQATRLLVSSLSQRSVTREVVYRALDLLVAHFHTAAALRTSFDNN